MGRAPTHGMQELEVVWGRDDPLVGEFFSDRWVGPHTANGSETEPDYEAGQSLASRLAVKVLPARFAKHAEAVERFRREAKVATRIKHPNLVEVLEVGRKRSGLPFLIVEQMEGEDLRACVEREAPLAPARAIRMVVQILRALEAVHAAGVVHRDVQPKNVFLVRRWGGREIVKLQNFGLARFLEGVETEHQPVQLPGIPQSPPVYFSPERARDEPGIDARSDVFGAGVILYELLSGRLPHAGERPAGASVAWTSLRPLSEVAPEVALDLAAAVDRAIARDPEHRFPNATEFLAALPSLPDSVDLDDFQPLAPRPRRRRAWIATSVATAIIAVAALLWFPGIGLARSPSGRPDVADTKDHTPAPDLPPVSTSPAVPGVPPTVAR